MVDAGQTSSDFVYSLHMTDEFCQEKGISGYHLVSDGFSEKGVQTDLEDSAQQISGLKSKVDDLEKNVAQKNVQMRSLELVVSELEEFAEQLFVEPLQCPQIGDIVEVQGGQVISGFSHDDVEGPPSEQAVQGKMGVSQNMTHNEIFEMHFQALSLTKLADFDSGLDALFDSPVPLDSPDPLNSLVFAVDQNKSPSQTSDPDLLSVIQSTVASVSENDSKLLPDHDDVE